MPSSPRMTLRVLAFVLALLVLLVAYYWIHKPFSPAQALTLGGALLDLLAGLLLLLLGAGIGRRGLARLPWADVQPAARVGIEAVTGLALLSFVGTGLALAGFFRAGLLWPLTLAGLLLSLPPLRGCWADFCTGWREIGPGAPWEWFFAGLSGLLVLLALMSALTPPHAWDELAYQLVGPSRLLGAGRLLAHGDIQYLGIPQGANVLFAWAMGLFGRETAAAPLHTLFGILGLLIVAGGLQPISRPGTPWVAITVIIGGFSVWLLMTWAYVDMAAFAYGAAATVALIAWRGRPGVGWLLLMGLLAGAAVAVKYTAAVLALALGGAVAVFQPRRLLPNALVVGGAALLMFAPWLLHGGLLYGSPVYPFLFDGLNWDATRASVQRIGGTGLWGSPEAWYLLVMPLAATIFGVDTAGRFTIEISPWLLTLPLLLPLGWRWLDDAQRQTAGTLLVMALPALLVWGVAGAVVAEGIQTRFMAPVFPMAAMLGALAYDGLWQAPQRPVRMGWLLRGVIAATLLLSLLPIFTRVGMSQPGRYLLGLLPRDDYLFMQLGTHYSAMQQLETLPAGAQVRLMWEPRSYYCPSTVRCLPDVLLDHWLYGMALADDDPAAVFAGWQAAGDDYLLVYEPGLAFFLREDPVAAPTVAAFPAAVADTAERIWQDGAGTFTLYRWP